MSHYGKKEIYALLDAKGIIYEAMEHEAVYTMEDMDRVGITSKGGICKNLFLRDAKKKNFFLISVPEKRQINLKTLADKIGSTRLSFVSPERLAFYLGVEQGCVSPFGVLNDESHSVTVIFDQSLQFSQSIGVHPNDNTASVWLDFKSLRRVIEEHGNPVKLINFD